MRRRRARTIERVLKSHVTIASRLHSRSSTVQIGPETTELRAEGFRFQRKERAAGGLHALRAVSSLSLSRPLARLFSFILGRKKEKKTLSESPPRVDRIDFRFESDSHGRFQHPIRTIDPSQRTRVPVAVRNTLDRSQRLVDPNGRILKRGSGASASRRKAAKTSTRSSVVACTRSRFKFDSDDTIRSQRTRRGLRRLSRTRSIVHSSLDTRLQPLSKHLT